MIAHKNDVELFAVISVSSPPEFEKVFLESCLLSGNTRWICFIFRWLKFWRSCRKTKT